MSLFENSQNFSISGGQFYGVEGNLHITNYNNTEHRARSIIEQAVKTFRIGKDEISDLLAPAKDLLVILNGAATVHPTIQNTVNVFRALIKVETDRREKDQDIAALYYIMIDLLSVLINLDPVFSQDNSLKSMLEAQLNMITVTMNQFGNFCEVYYKHKNLGKTVWVLVSSRDNLKGQLEDFAYTFTNQKKDLHFLAVQKSTISVANISSNLDTVADQVRNLVVAFLDIKSEKDKKLDDLISKLGGPEAVINNDKQLEEIARQVREQVTTTMKYLLHTDFQSQLKANLSLYHFKIDTTKETIERSTQTILLRLDSGPHDIIEDPDIKAVWKEMGWKGSCKARHFVDAVQHHFVTAFSQYQASKGEPHPDQWTLKYLSKVVFYPAIGDAIDKDGSGYIGVLEANDFFRDKDPGWSTPQWLAYWAAGWYKNALEYSRCASSLLRDIIELGESVHPQNKPHLEVYLSDSTTDTRLMVESLYWDTLDYHGVESEDEVKELENLCMQRRKHDLAMMEGRLNRTKYQLDNIQAVTGTDRAEIHVLALMYLILKRHKRILTLAQELVLAKEEFFSLFWTVRHISDAFLVRLNNLEEYWRQQRLDATLQVRCFSGGIFEDRWKEKHDDNDDESLDGDYIEAEDEGTEQAGSKETQGGGEEGAEDGEDRSRDRQLEEEGAAAGNAADKYRDILVWPLPPQPKPGANTGPAESHEDLEDKGMQAESTTEPDDKVETVEKRLERIEALLEKLLLNTNRKPEASQPVGSRQMAGDGARQTTGDGVRQTTGDGARRMTGDGARRTTGDGARQMISDGTRQMAGYGASEPRSRETAGYGARQMTSDAARQMAGYGASQPRSWGTTGYEASQPDEESRQMAGYEATQPDEESWEPTSEEGDEAGQPDGESWEATNYEENNYY